MTSEVIAEEQMCNCDKKYQQCVQQQQQQRSSPNSSELLHLSLSIGKTKTHNKINNKIIKSCPAIANTIEYNKLKQELLLNDVTSYFEGCKEEDEEEDDDEDIKRFLALFVVVVVVVPVKDFF